jgi:hypothetical protein
MPFTLSALRTLVRQRSDTENDGHITDAELTNYVNASFAELYDILTSRFEDYFITEPAPQYVLTGTTNTISLPADFYKMRGLDYLANGTDDWVEVKKFNFADRNKRRTAISRLANGYPYREYRVLGSLITINPPQQAAGTYQLWYIPRFAPLVLDLDVLTGVLDFEEYIVVDAALKCVIKQEGDITALKLSKADLVKRISEMASNRDAGEPETIADASGSFLNRGMLWQ